MFYSIRAIVGLNINGSDKYQDDNEALVVELCMKHFPEGVSTFDGVGLWEGFGQEKIICIEKITDRREDETRMIQLAGEYKEVARQEAVIVTVTEIQSSIII